MKISVSILKSNYSELETIKRINETKANYIHLDIMDGIFVDNTTPEFEYLNESNKPLQVHLMVVKPYEYINRYNLSNVESIIIQSELDDNLEELLKYIKSLNKRAGLAINPETDISILKPYLSLLDDVLVLTVHPGLGGQKMIPEVASKIDELYKIREDNSLNFETTVDGGVNDSTIELVKNADISVIGSFICMSDDFNAQIDKIMAKL